MGVVANLFGRKEEPAVPKSIPVVIEKRPEFYVAYNDEVQVIATGETPDEAIAKFKECLEFMMESYADDVKQQLAGRQYQMVEMP